MTTNPAVLAASLSGRLLFMSERDARHWASALLRHAGAAPEGKSGLSRLLGWARRASAAPVSKDDDQIEAEAAAPRRHAAHWLGEVDAAGFGWVLKDGIAIIRVDGVLVDEGFWSEWSGWVHGYDTLSATLAEVAADDRVKGVLFRIKSPGGVASSGLPALASQIRELGKPVWSWCEYALSAAFWLAVSGDRIVGGPLSMIGSAGAVQTHCDMSGNLEADGIKVTHFKFGARKTDGSPFERLSDEAAAAFQSDTDQCGRIFVADIVAGRPSLTEEQVIATQAETFLCRHDDPARSGLALGFCDAIASEQETFQRFAAFLATGELPSADPAPEPEPETPPAAPVSGAASAAPKETSMRSKPQASAPKQSKAERIAAIDASAEDKLDRIQQILDEPDEEDEGDTPEDEGGDGGTEEQPAAASDAQRIAASTEAKAHPHLANAAIASGQTFAQFKASVDAQAAAPRTRQLPGAMANSKRLGPDASATGGSGERQPSALARRAEERRKAAQA